MTRNLCKAIQRDVILYVQQHRPYTILSFIISNIFVLLPVTDEFMHALNILHFTLLILFHFFTLDFLIFVFYDIAPLFATQIHLMHNIDRA